MWSSRLSFKNIDYYYIHVSAYRISSFINPYVTKKIYPSLVGQQFVLLLNLDPHVFCGSQSGSKGIKNVVKGIN